MNALKKNAAVKKFSPLVTAGASDADIESAIKADEKPYADDEVIEILAALKSEAASEKTDFDYRNLVDKEFERYNAYINSLPWDEKRDFELYPAEGIFKFEFDSNLEKVKVQVGVRLKDVKPKNTTRIQVIRAKDLNSQIEQNTAAGTGFYYLLKQSA